MRENGTELYTNIVLLSVFEFWYQIGENYEENRILCISLQTSCKSIIVSKYKVKITKLIQDKRLSLWQRIGSVQPLSRIRLSVTPWAAAHQASLSITNSRSLLKLRSIKSVMPSNHLILCRPLLLLPSIFPSTQVFSKELVLRISWPKYWSFSFSWNG